MFIIEIHIILRSVQISSSESALKPTETIQSNIYDMCIYICVNKQKITMFACFVAVAVYMRCTRTLPSAFHLFHRAFSVFATFLSLSTSLTRTHAHINTLSCLNCWRWPTSIRFFFLIAAKVVLVFQSIYIIIIMIMTIVQQHYSVFFFTWFRMRVCFYVFFLPIFIIIDVSIVLVRGYAVKSACFCLFVNDRKSINNEFHEGVFLFRLYAYVWWVVILIWYDGVVCV